MSEKKDLVIIGSGPAGLSAAVYAKRAMLSVVVIEKAGYSGGQIVVTDRVDNYLGMYGENGYELSQRFREHADALKVPFVEEAVVKVIDRGDKKEVHLESNTVIETDAVIFATGAKNRLLGVDGEQEFTGAGVSYCATCDGAFFKGGVTAVVGGGDVALEDAIYLSGICKKVYLIHRRGELRGAKSLQEKIFSTENIQFLPHTEVKQICGSQKTACVRLFDNQTKEEWVLNVDGVFIAVGRSPESEVAQPLVQLDEGGYICAGEDCRTSVPKIYAAGDVRTKQLRQIVTAVADGAVAVSSYEQDR